MANQTKHLYPGAFRCEFDRRLPKDVQASHLALFLFSLLQTISTILLNSTTIITYWKSTRLKEKTTNFMIMTLSVNDLVVGLSSNIMYLIIVWKEYSSGTTQCYIYAFQFCTQAIMSGCSLVTLVVMSFERYAAICHPFYHRTKVTKNCWSNVCYYFGSKLYFVQLWQRSSWFASSASSCLRLLSVYFCCSSSMLEYSTHIENPQQGCNNKSAVRLRSNLVWIIAAEPIRNWLNRVWSSCCRSLRVTSLLCW